MKSVFPLDEFMGWTGTFHAARFHRESQFKAATAATNRNK